MGSRSKSLIFDKRYDQNGESMVPQGHLGQKGVLAGSAAHI